MTNIAITNSAMAPTTAAESPDLPSMEFKRGDILTLNFDGTNGRGESRLRSALPIATKMQCFWPGPLDGKSPAAELGQMINSHQTLIDIEDRLSAASRDWIEQLLKILENALASEDLQLPDSPTAAWVTKTLVGYGVSQPEVFSVSWLVQSVEEELQKLHIKMRSNAESRDAHLTTLGTLKMNKMMVEYLIAEAQYIDSNGLDLDDDCHPEPADLLSAHLQAFVSNPLWVGWPQPEDFWAF